MKAVGWHRIGDIRVNDVHRSANLGRSGKLDPVRIPTEAEPMTGAIDAYEAFDERQPDWMKVALESAA